MKTARQLVSFVLGVAVGVCLYSFFKLRPLFQTGPSTLSPQVGENHPGKALRSLVTQGPFVEPATPAVVKRVEKPVQAVTAAATVSANVHSQVHPAAHPQTETVQIAELHRSGEVTVASATLPPPAPATHKPVERVGGVAVNVHPAQPAVSAKEVANVRPAQPGASAKEVAGVLAGRTREAAVAQPPATREIAAVIVHPAPPAPTVFKPIGYVEKAGGQAEAIILQDNEVQVVHTGELIAGRYRVTRVSPDSVEATDETLAQSPMTKPDKADSKELAAENAPTPVTPAGAPAIAVVATELDRMTEARPCKPLNKLKNHWDTLRKLMERLRPWLPTATPSGSSPKCPQ